MELKDKYPKIQAVLDGESEGCIVCADCLDVMKEMPDGCVDAVVTDPPYGDAETHGKHLSTVVSRQALGFNGISKRECVQLAARFVEISKRWTVFTCEWHFLEALHQTGLLVRFGIWRKPNGAPQFTGDRPGMGWEAIAICHPVGKKRWNGGGKHGFYMHCTETGGHPTQKPVALFGEFVTDFTDSSDIIFDPFCGSGTTCVAAKKLGRRWIGIDINEEYCDIARDRLLGLEGKRLGKLQKHKGFFDVED